MPSFDRWTLAWLFGCLVFAAHIAEEVAYGSFGAYADFDVLMSALVPWLHLPPYRYETWLINLIGACAVLFALTWLVHLKRAPMRIASFVFATFLTLNGTGHLYAALTMDTYFPGAVTSAVMVAAGLLLFVSIPVSQNSQLSTR